MACRCNRPAAGRGLLRAVRSVRGWRGDGFLPKRDTMCERKGRVTV